MTRKFWFSRVSGEKVDAAETSQYPNMPVGETTYRSRHAPLNVSQDSGNNQGNNSTDSKPPEHQYYKNKNYSNIDKSKGGTNQQFPERFKKYKPNSNNFEATNRSEHMNSSECKNYPNNQNSNSNHQPPRPNCYRQWTPPGSYIPNPNCYPYREPEMPGIPYSPSYDPEQGKHEGELPYPQANYHMQSNDGPPCFPPWIPLPVHCNEFVQYFGNDTNHNNAMMHYWYENTPNVLRPGGPPLMFKNIDVTAQISVEKDFSDLPVKNLENLRFFYNLGVRYFRLGSLVCPPIQFSSSQDDSSQQSSPENQSQDRSRRPKKQQRNPNEEGCDSRSCKEWRNMGSDPNETQYESGNYVYPNISAMCSYYGPHPNQPVFEEVPRYEDVYQNQNPEKVPEGSNQESNNE